MNRSPRPDKDRFSRPRIRHRARLNSTVTHADSSHSSRPEPLFCLPKAPAPFSATSRLVAATTCHTESLRRLRERLLMGFELSRSRIPDMVHFARNRSRRSSETSKRSVGFFFFSFCACRSSKPNWRFGLVLIVSRPRRETLSRTDAPREPKISRLTIRSISPISRLMTSSRHGVSPRWAGTLPSLWGALDRPAPKFAEDSG
jgi:hypothetical protein